MEKALLQYMEYHEKNYSDEEYDITNNTVKIEKEESHELVHYEEAFAYKKEHSCKIVSYCVMNKGTYEFMTCDEKGTVKLWGLNSKMSIFTFDLYQMTEFLYHLNKTCKFVHFLENWVLHIC